MSDPTATKGAQQFGDLFGAYLARATAGDDDPLPAKVLAYDRVKQMADCQVLVKVPVDNELTDPPPVHGAQVLWLSGGTWSIVGDLVPGDVGWLVPPGADTSRWARFGTERSAEVTPDAKSLADAFFIPGSRPASAPLPAAAYKAAALVIAAEALLLGSSAATKPIALHLDDVNKDATNPGFDFASWMASVETVAQAGGGVVSPSSNLISKIGAVQASSTKVKAE
jgi:hypothetical protein